LKNQKDYMERAERELLRKHATELKQQPKSLKVRLTFHCQQPDFNLLLLYFSKRNSRSESSSVRHVKHKLVSIRH
jgi:hypothetical protein